MKIERCPYIAHRLNAPTRAGIEANRTNASIWVCELAARFPIAPIADWLILTGRWPETMRDRGLAVDLALVERADEVWLVGPVISSGMGLEAAHARALGKPVYDLTGLTLDGGFPLNKPEGRIRAVLDEIARVVQLPWSEAA